MSASEQNMPTVGQPAPDFTLPSSNGGKWSLHDMRGKKVVLYFYPKDMTPTCTQQSCDFRDYNKEFESLGAKIVGISTDDLKAHTKFKEKYSLPFTLLSDPDHKVCELYRVWNLKKNFGHEYMGIERSTFLIDEEGKLVREWRKVRIKNHIQDILNVIKST